MRQADFFQAPEDGQGRSYKRPRIGLGVAWTEGRASGDRVIGLSSPHSEALLSHPLLTQVRERGDFLSTYVKLSRGDTRPASARTMLLNLQRAEARAYLKRPHTSGTRGLTAFIVEVGDSQLHSSFKVSLFSSPKAVRAETPTRLRSRRLCATRALHTEILISGLNALS